MHSLSLFMCTCRLVERVEANLYKVNMVCIAVLQCRSIYRERKLFLCFVFVFVFLYFGFFL